MNVPVTKSGLKITVGRGGVFTYWPREISQMEEAVKLMATDKRDGIQSEVRPDKYSWCEAHWPQVLTMFNIQADDLPW